MKKHFLVFVLFYTTALCAQEPITLEDIWIHGKFSAKGVTGFRSMNDGKYYTAQDENENIIQYSFATGKPMDTLLKAQEVGVRGFGYDFSNDEQKVLLQFNYKQIYRHSFSADMLIYDRKTNSITKPERQGVMLAEFSPDGNKIAYVSKNNLYIYDLLQKREIQVTEDGFENNIINGSTDWVYEEEFALSKGFYWSVDGKKLAYYRFDESKVKEFNMPMYGKLYPEDYRFKYPKAGEDNSVIEIYTYDIASGKKVKADIGSEKDIYIPRIHWTNSSNTLMIQRMNRLQNKLEFLLTSATDGSANIIYTEENKAYIDVPEITFLADNKSFIINSEKSGYNHLYHYDLKGKLIRQITNGNWDIDNFYGLNTARKIIYVSTSEENTTERYVYEISLDGKKKSKLTTRKGWNSATFNSDFTYFLHTWSDINTPPVYSLCDTKGKEVRVLEENQVLNNRLKEAKFSTGIIQPMTNAYNETLNAFMIKPANFDELKKYPVLMYVYGGPGHQLAVNRWMGANYFWFQLLAQKGYIIVCADGRGTGFKGEAFKKITYLQLGKYEIEDQIYLAKQLGQLSYVDPARIGMFGWSFGGYMSSLAITKGSDVFKAAIAVAPVTNWRYYDNIYTERFMRTPKENGKNYDENSPINFVDKIKGNYLIIHGTADDNVHFQNAVEMVNAMINKGVKFDSEFYPNKNHGIGGGKTRLHLYERMTRFILEKL
jgi:dipeptidyl-peptidase 4